ncbi:MAG: NHLP family bacteriocin export ABC transporter peptidase/permease/ATPase subunit [Clostridiaceae bacterium]|nr:NHLP family bacteriocin export ABC transporter peptidase/permease/ATPase subunit [Clostridiaceae bacterium]
MRKKIAKVPVILQMEAVECGAASLAMILAYHGKYVPLEEVRVACGVSRDGSNAKNIAKAAMSYGLRVRAFRKDVESLKQMDFPVIIHWNFNHFVVLNGFTKKHAVLNDPESGVRKVSLEEFDSAFTGIVLSFEKGENFVKGGKPKNVLMYLVRRLEGSKQVITLILLIGFLSSMIGIIIPLYSRFFVDNILFNKRLEWMNLLLAAMGITMLISFILDVLKSNYLLKMKAKLALVSSAVFVWHVLTLPVVFFTQRYVGDIASRQENNEDIAEVLCSKLAPIILNLLMIVLYLCIMLTYSIPLTIVGVAAALINLVTLLIVSKTRESQSQALQRDYGKLMGFTISGIEMIETIKSGGIEGAYFSKWAGYQAKHHNSNVAFNKLAVYLSALPVLLMDITNIIILIAGVYYVLDGKFTVGMLIAFQSFAAAFLEPVNSLVETGSVIQDMRGKMEQIEDVMNYPAETKKEKKDKDVPRKYEQLSGNITVRDLTFGYNPLEPPLIKGFNLDIKKGSSVALVGGSGSGKSTIARLIVGLYKVNSGQVLFDGKPREEIDDVVFSSSVAVVDQEITMFEGTIKDNITMWDDTIDEADIIRACKDACIHDDIMSRPEGYMHKIIEGGRNFSGGQRQRFEIAKALAINPSIIILDEATSALDPNTEHAIMQAIKRRNMTCIIIAHRLSTIRDCDEIIVLEQGQVIQRGTHEELIKQEGKYKELVQLY